MGKTRHSAHSDHDETTHSGGVVVEIVVEIIVDTVDVCAQQQNINEARHMSSIEVRFKRKK
jgi:hypothetical protein